MFLVFRDILFISVDPSGIITNISASDISGTIKNLKAVFVPGKLITPLYPINETIGTNIISQYSLVRIDSVHGFETNSASSSATKGEMTQPVKSTMRKIEFCLLPALNISVIEPAAPTNNNTSAIARKIDRFDEDLFNGVNFLLLKLPFSMDGFTFQFHHDQKEYGTLKTPFLFVLDRYLLTLPFLY